MLVVTTPTVEGAPVKQYIGMVSGETIAGVNVFKDFGASLSNMFGGRASQYEEEIGNAAATAVNEMCARAQSMGANAVVGVNARPPWRVVAMSVAAGEDGQRRYSAQASDGQ